MDEAESMPVTDIPPKEIKYRKPARKRDGELPPNPIEDMYKAFYEKPPQDTDRRKGSV